MIDLENIPQKPGVYIYRNINNHIIYVGKAINLKKRVSQYFQRDDALSPKTQQLVSQIYKVDYKIVGSEIEALVLEASLIKKHRPKYNSLLKDDRSYIYICITKDKLPRVFSTHKSKVDQDVIFYGPFPNGQAVKSLLKTIRRIFPYISVKNHPKKECLYCHLKLCPGPNPDPKMYRQNISGIKKILSGKLKKLDQQLKKGMKKASLEEDYDLALNLRNQLTSLEYITSGWQNLSSLYEKINIPEDDKLAAINELKMTLDPYFSQIKNINRIECYDISNLGPKYFVGSMSVFQNSIFDKNEYRKFKIRTKDTQDDQYMIKRLFGVD
jgi:excinuclease ABC subunit C